MPYKFSSPHCDVCPPASRCIEDRRSNPVKGRKTIFRILQGNATYCTFDDFIPGYESPAVALTYNDYLRQWQANATRALAYLFPDTPKLTDPQKAKSAGDILQNLVAAGLWNVAADWNQYMDHGEWPANTPFRCPDVIPSPDRKLAIIPLPRGYDTTKLFTPDTRRSLEYFYKSMADQDMDLRLSAPDIVGIRLPHPLPAKLGAFLKRLPNLRRESYVLLERACELLKGLIEGRHFMFAMAIKASVRSDRLFQPLFEANTLKYLVRDVLKGPAFKFDVVVMDAKGAAVEKHYRAASLLSLLRGGTPERAVDRLLPLTTPSDLFEAVAGQLPKFP